MRFRALWLLDLAEKMFLWVNGWRREGRDAWTSPPEYPRQKVGIPQGYAVNSIKAYARLYRDVSWRWPWAN